MTNTNKKLAKQIANTIKMIDVKLWENSSKENVQLVKTRSELWQSILSLGYQLQVDYTLITNSVKQPYDLSQIKSEGEYPSKTVQIIGHTVKYWYEDGFENEICDNDPDFDDIQEALCGGYREGEFNTFENETETHHYGYWEIVKS